LAASWVEVWNYDKETSEALGYISDSKGIPLKLDDEWNPVAPKNQFWMDAKITNFKDGNDNTYVYTNWELTSIIDNQGNISRWEQLKTVKVPAQVEEDKTISERRKRETSLRNEFIKRPEVKRFQEIRSQFERVKQWASANNASWDLALIFSFMKMLDPASVVREGEFATAQNAAGVPDQVRNLFNKVQTWERLNPTQRNEFKTTAENLFKSEIDNFEWVKEWFKTIIEDAGARSEFVLVWEDLETGSPDFELNEEESSDLDNIFGSTETSTTWKKSFTTWSGKSFNINFNLEDQTSWKKDIPTSWFAEKVNISRTGTNVAKDTNNPWNITADSIPAWQTKEGYGKAIGATGTYLSSNGREYFIFPDVESWTWALQRDIQAKISWNSRNIKPTDTLARFQRVYVWANEPNYLAVLKRITWASDNTPIKDIDAWLLTQAVMKAEWFIK